MVKETGFTQNHIVHVIDIYNGKCNNLSTNSTTADENLSLSIQKVTWLNNIVIDNNHL